MFTLTNGNKIHRGVQNNYKKREGKKDKTKLTLLPSDQVLR